MASARHIASAGTRCQKNRGCCSSGVDVQQVGAAQHQVCSFRSSQRHCSTYTLSRSGHSGCLACWRDPRGPPAMQSFGESLMPAGATLQSAHLIMATLSDVGAGLTHPTERGCGAVWRQTRRNAPELHYPVCPASGALQDAGLGPRRPQTGCTGKEARHTGSRTNSLCQDTNYRQGTYVVAGRAGPGASRNR